MALGLFRLRLPDGSIRLACGEATSGPSELLAEGMKHRFFPALWEVRDELFAEWTRAHPRGADHGYHG